MKTPSARVTLPVLAIVCRARAQLATPVDGRYGPMDPDDLRLAIEWLGREVDLEGINDSSDRPHLSLTRSA